MTRLCMLSLLVLTLLPLTGDAATPIKERVVIGMPEWCPYTCEDSENPGILVEITKKVLESKGISPEFRIYDNWKRLLYDGRKGKIDAVLAIAPGEEPALIFPVEPMVDVSISFFIRKGDSWTFDGKATSFDGKVLMGYENVEYGSVVGAYIAANRNDRSRVELATGETEEVMMHKLAAGHGDIYLEDKHVGLYMIKHEKLQEKVKLAPRLDKPERVGLGIGFSPKFPAAQRYAASIDEALKNLRENGENGTIIRRYITP